MRTGLVVVEVVKEARVGCYMMGRLSIVCPTAVFRRRSVVRNSGVMSWIGEGDGRQGWLLDCS